MGGYRPPAVYTANESRWYEDRGDSLVSIPHSVLLPVGEGTTDSDRWEIH